MKTNDIKKGTEIRMSDGFTGIMEDNKKGNIRMATINGIFTEMGSIYAHNITAAKNTNGDWERIELTTAQLKMKQSGW